MRTPSTRTLAALAYERGEEADPAHTDAGAGGVAFGGVPRPPRLSAGQVPTSDVAAGSASAGRRSRRCRTGSRPTTWCPRRTSLSAASPCEGHAA
jgi:hypothetical protein